MDITKLFCENTTPVLYRQGEYGNDFSYDYNCWLKEFGPGSIGWLIQRSQDESAYPLPSTEENGISTIEITETESQYAGKAVFEVFFVNDGSTEKRVSRKLYFMVDSSLQNLGTVPEPWESYVDAVHEDRVAIENMSATAEVSNNQFGVPNVDVTKSIIDDHVNLDFDFTNLKGNGITDAHLNADYTLTLDFNEGSYTTPSIRGEQGPQGIQGPQGEKGDTGDVNFATFEVDENGNLICTWTYDNSGLAFSINNNGYLEVTINE